MGTNRLTKSIYGVATAAVVFSYASWGKYITIPQEMPYFNEAEKTRMSEYYNPNPYYVIYEHDSIILEQVEIIHQFVSKISKNIQDLDPRFSDIINKHFWELF